MLLQWPKFCPRLPQRSGATTRTFYRRGRKGRKGNKSSWRCVAPYGPHPPLAARENSSQAEKNSNVSNAEDAKDAEEAKVNLSVFNLALLLFLTIFRSPKLDLEG